MTTAAPRTRAATWAEYEALGENRQAEYIDGQIVMSPAPTRAHQAGRFRLTQLLIAAVPPTHEVASGWGWKPDADEFIPDVTVFARTEETLRYTGKPTLAVEVLSSNRSNDLVLKLNKYAEAGLPYYWIVDLRDRVLLAHALVDGQYVLRTRVLPGHPVEVGFGIATAHLDLDELLTPL